MEAPASKPLPWDDPAWSSAEILEITDFQSRGSSHRPRTRVRLAHDGEHLHLVFRVEDRWVRSVCRNYQDMVCRDSCVEFFVQPLPDAGYFSFEMNAGGCLLLYYITDPERLPEGGFRAYEKVPSELGRTVQIRSSLPVVVDPEIATPVTWSLSCSIPIALLEHYVGSLSRSSGQSWRGNFFKCGDATSHPHWGMWSPVREGWSFHQPQAFGELILE